MLFDVYSILMQISLNNRSIEKFYQLKKKLRSLTNSTTSNLSKQNSNHHHSRFQESYRSSQNVSFKKQNSPPPFAVKEFDQTQRKRKKSLGKWFGSSESTHNQSMGDILRQKQKLLNSIEADLQMKRKLLSEVNQKLVRCSNNFHQVFRNMPPVQEDRVKFQQRTSIKAPDLYRMREENSKKRLKQTKQKKKMFF